MDDAVAVVERELGGPPDAVERVEEGLLHETYRVRRGDDEYVVQFVDHDEGRADDPRRGLGCYRLLADSRVPVPEPITDEVRTHRGRAYTVVKALPGSAIERDPTPERARLAGRVLAHVHDVAGFEDAGWLRFEGDVAVVDPFQAGSLRRRVLGDLDDRLVALRREGLDDAAAAAERFLDRHHDGVPGEFRPVLCHGDFTPDNLLFEGDRLTGVIDFDRARASHAHRDLARAANAFWMHDPTADWEVRETLYEGYRGVRDLRPSFERTEPVYRVETLVRTLAGMLELDEFSDYERTFYDEHVPQVVADAGSALSG